MQNVLHKHDLEENLQVLFVTYSMCSADIFLSIVKLQMNVKIFPLCQSSVEGMLLSVENISVLVATKISCQSSVRILTFS